ncbi:MAG: DUF4404 family protein [Betaproteobacteria bacterium]|nr:DUF4404 family protein [Betaproteobacteria bacterium]
MKDIKDQLSQIHASLSRAKSVDPELKKKLIALDQDIQRLLKKEDESTFAYAGLEEVARGLAVKFANEHPNMALMIGQLADILGKMGI